MTAPTLPLMPGASTAPGAGACAETERYWPWAVPTTPASGPPDDAYTRGHSPSQIATGRARAQDPDYPEWLNHIKGAAACKHPIRLVGDIHVKNRAGDDMGTISTDTMPDGAIYTPCGNRRASVCPSCAETYRKDTYHLIKAGLEGDRWGLPPLNQHIAIFLTATAPSFGLVHHRVVKKHAADCRKKDGCTCRAAVCHPFGKTCAHGLPKQCTARHRAGDSQLGQPLCLDCYDHAAQVVWNHEAPELWRRTIQEFDRDLKRLGKRHGVELRRRYLKVFEFQVRGVIHYHALIRLDGYHPDCPTAIVPADRVITRQMFAAVLEDAFRSTSYTCAPHPANGGNGWQIRWGQQGLDLKHINAPGGEVNLTKVSGYIAKYTTKSTEVTGQTFRRFDDLSVDVYADPDTHLGRLIRACWDLGDHPDWHRLRRWAHQYGYGGHITTKSRAFSVTYGFQRMERTIWRRTEGHPHTWDDEQADLVVYRLGYDATGWITTGDALLANSAADAARARQQAARDALDDEYQAAISARLTAA